MYFVCCFPLHYNINITRRSVDDLDLSCTLMCLEWCLACNKGSVSPEIKGASQSG